MREVAILYKFAILSEKKWTVRKRWSLSISKEEVRNDALTLIWNNSDLFSKFPQNTGPDSLVRAIWGSSHDNGTRYHFLNRVEAAAENCVRISFCISMLAMLCRRDGDLYQYSNP